MENNNEVIYSTTDDLARQTSIRLVPNSPKSRYPEALPRPSLHHADSNIVVTTNRKITIIERDGTPTPGQASPSSPAGTGNISPSILARRGVDRSRLALVSPPDAAPSNQGIQSSPPSAAAFALSKSSRTKYADIRTSPTTNDGPQFAHYSNHAHANRSHGRSSSEVTATGPSHGAKHPTIVPKSSSGDMPKSPRDVGIIGTVRSFSKRSELETKVGSKHRRRESTGHASSGSDYGDDPTVARPGDVSANQPTFSPVFQNPRQDEPSSQRSLGSGSASSASHGMHLPLPAAPRTFGSSSNRTPLLTPAIGDGKPIDLKVAAPVVVDIRSDLADLWLAATPDGDFDFSSAGSPMTATTTTTESSSIPTSSSTASSGQSSVTSPPKSRTQHHGPVFDTGLVSLPPRHIDVNALSPGSSPICPPRPQRQPSPAKRPTPLSTQEGDPMSASITSLSNRTRESDNTHAGTNQSDSKYALLAVSDDESSSDYSNQIQ